MSKEQLQQALDALLGYKPQSLTHAKEQEAAVTALRAAISQPDTVAQAEPISDAAYKEAASLAMCIFKLHYATDPDYATGQVTFSLCDSTAGVISQIDNMVAGLTRVKPPIGAQE